MDTYEIIYDYCDEEGFCEERNLRETFQGTYSEMRGYLEKMMDSGCYNISVTEIYSEDG